MDSIHFNSYIADFLQYRLFKNAPFPRFERSVDLMIGTEGQLGIITEVEIETTENEDVTHVFILLPRWEGDDEPHMEIFRTMQSHRPSVLSCELLDSNCIQYLKPKERPGSNHDLIFLEIKSSAFDDIYHRVFCCLSRISQENVFKIAESQFHRFRTDVPLFINEENSRGGVLKVGTDVQVTADKFSALMNTYREFSRMGIRYCLFGHFGDAHLHFNFMPAKEQAAQCDDIVEKFYENVYAWQGSPFAEHGIGLIKQKYIGRFYGQNQRGLFHDIKKVHDPYNQFFPQGFMSQA